MAKRFWLTGAVLLIAATTLPVEAVPPADERWLAFEGCWRPSDGTPGNLLCVVTEAEGVRMVELANGEIVRETRMTIDGRPRAVSQEGCSGSEVARWADHGRRLYLTTQMTCGNQIARNTTGLFALVSAREWVSIQAIAVDNEAATRIVRYELVEAPTSVPESIMASLRQNRLARETARYAASAPLTFHDLAEASKQVHGRAVEALLFERKQTFDLNAQKLLALADAGLPNYLIDAVIAVSHPDKYAIRNTQAVELEPVEVPAAQRAGGYSSRYCDDFDIWYSRYCDGMRYGSLYSSRYGGFGFSPFGYGNYGYGYGRYGFRSNPVIVVANPNDSAPVPRHGRITRNGYSNSGPSGGTTRSTSSSSSSGSRSSSVSSGSSSSSSSGSSSRSSGATSGPVKPRGGG